MKKILILTLCMTITSMQSIIANTFYQRYGANSHITQTPLFFKQAYTDDRECARSRKRKICKDRRENIEAQQVLVEIPQSKTK